MPYIPLDEEKYDFLLEEEVDAESKLLPNLKNPAKVSPENVNDLESDKSENNIVKI